MNILNKLKNISNYETVIFVAVMLSLVAGITPSFIYSDWTWFSRSGALLATFGIYVIWLDYEGKINNDLDTIRDGFLEYLKTASENESSRSNTERDVSNQFNKVRVATKKRFQNIEFSLVALGTLIWAYGDLINKFY